MDRNSTGEWRVGGISLRPWRTNPPEADRWYRRFKCTFWVEDCQPVGYTSYSLDSDGRQRRRHRWVRGAGSFRKRGAGFAHYSSQIFHRKVRKDRKGPPYFRKLGRLDCSERSSSTLVCSLVRAGNTGGFSACFASFAVQMQCLGSLVIGHFYRKAWVARTSWSSHSRNPS